MSGRNRPSRPRAVPLLVALALVPAASCWNGVGITCPEGDVACLGGDLSASVPDLAAGVRDLSSEDLRPTIPPDFRGPDPTADLATCMTHCKSGCCDEAGACHDPTDKSFCGTGGKACAPCDAIRDNTCDAKGTCGCNGGPSCRSGYHCFDKGCVCDGTSCPAGCCEPNLGCAPLGFPYCAGAAGDMCNVCDKLTTNACDKNGKCICGNGGPCDAGQQCVAANGGVAQCQCNALSCPTGCCSNNTCIKDDLNNCGKNGGACAPCDGKKSNRCIAGVCACENNGVAAICEIGQYCNGGCVCSNNSCPDGCCNAKGLCVNGVAGCGLPGNCGMGCQGPALCINGQCLQVGNQCINVMGTPFLCAFNKKCVASCGACQIAGRPSVSCNGICVSGCADCFNFPKTCVEKGGSMSCVADCAKCVAPGAVCF